MQRGTKTYNALIISLLFHTMLMLWLSLYISKDPERFKDLVSVILVDEADLPQPKSRKPYLLPKIDPLVPRARRSVARSGQTPENTVEFTELTPAASIHSDDVVSPKAPIESDAVPDFVTHANTLLTVELTLPDTSSGDKSHATSPSQSGVRRGKGAAGRGIGKVRHRGDDLGKRFIELTTESDPVEMSALTLPANVPKGLGIFDTMVLPGHGLLGEVYVPGRKIYRMPNFNTLKPIYSFLAAKLDIKERAYTEGFPTPTNLTVVENFAIRFRGLISIETTGRYRFALRADDGAQLYIDGYLVVDNDGIHQTAYRQGSIALTRGFHFVEIRYFQGPRFHIALQWYYQPFGKRERIVPSSIIYRPNRLRAERLQK
jgi:hypothetical protein